MGDLVKKETHLKVVKEKSIHEEVTEELFAEIIEMVLPKIKPAIKPATKRFAEYMRGEGETPLKNGRKILIDIVDGKVYLFVIKAEDLEQFELKEGTEPEHTYDIETFIQMILSGQFK